MLCDETKYICYINLASAGKCTYGSSCKYEHTSMLYVWKIANFTKKAGSKSSLISNKTFSNSDCEKLEKAFSNPEYQDKTFQIK